MHYLEALDGDICPSRITLDRQQVIIGRDRRCDLVVSDADISRNHAVVERRADGWYIHDLDSTNGITVDDRRVGSHRLEPGEVVGVGPARLLFSVGSVSSQVHARLDSLQVQQLLSGHLTREGVGDPLHRLLEIAATLEAMESYLQLLERCGELLCAQFEPDLAVVQIDSTTWTFTSAELADSQHAPSLSQTVLDRVTKQGEAIVYSEGVIDADLSGQVSLQMQSIHSAMGAPLQLSGEPAGYVYVDRRRTRRRFEESTLVDLVGFCRLVSSLYTLYERFQALEAATQLLGSQQGLAGTIVGSAPCMQQLRQDVEQRLATVDATVLLEGETGTGKNLVAEAIHLASNRRTKPFVKVNCAAIPRELLESELFGHQKGAFTGATHNKPGQFEMAHQGTLFLDEVGELDPSAQAKLLSFIQDRRIQRVGSTQARKVDVRILAATNRCLADEAEQGNFRLDLLYRLKVVLLEIPPLRERVEDIPLLAVHFLKQATEAYKRRIPGFTDNALEALTRYAWPGNIRELSNCIERAVIYGDESRPLDCGHLPVELRVHTKTSPGSFSLAEVKERELIQDALRQAAGNKSQAARIIGWYPQKLYHRLRKYDL